MADIPKTMKGARLHRNGDPSQPDVLSVEEVSVPEPGAGEILIRVHAAAINPIDWKLCKGVVPGKKSGRVGFDVAGTVVKLGEDLEGCILKVGDAVYADAAKTLGSFAEFAVVKSDALALKPSDLTFREAASLPLAGLTAIQGLITKGGLAEGGKVAIYGGSGGVGSLAVQIAKAMGCEVFATGSSVDFIKKLGADHVINYREQSIQEELAGKELDCVFDCVGGKDGWIAAQGALRSGGKFSTIVGDDNGLLGMATGILWRKLASNFGSHEYNIFLTNVNAPDMKKLSEFVEAGKVKPILDDRDFELSTESLNEMMAASMSHRTKGKLVMTVYKE